VSEKTDAVKDLFSQGYNCAQAVLGAFCKELNIDKETALKISSPFGGGMGGQREVCGALSAMLMIIGLKYGYASAKKPEEKKKLYALVKELTDKFKAENGSIICGELTGSKEIGQSQGAKSAPCRKRRSCMDIVCGAAKTIEDYIENSKR
jgi:C_GCAxxG_C_C family probable redox protein